MTNNIQPARSLDIEITETAPDKITVLLKGNSKETQRVSYGLETRGASKTIHKGTTTLVANSPTVLSTISFSGSKCWSVTLSVTEEVAGAYKIVRSNDCD